MSKQKVYDVAIFACTSFTATFALQYISKHYTSNSAIPQQVTFLFVGRNLKRIENLLQEIAIKTNNGNITKFNIMIADITDPKSIDAVTSASKVLLNFAGPYTNFGSNVIQSCVNNRCYYCDIGGEVNFVRDIIVQYDRLAKSSFTKLVFFCGFDSIPNDLGNYLVQERALSIYGIPCDKVVAGVTLRGSSSHGTKASGRIIYGALSRAELDDPTYLRSAFTNKEKHSFAPKFSFYHRYADYKYIIRAPMGVIDPKVIEMTNYLLDDRYKYATFLVGLTYPGLHPIAALLASISVQLWTYWSFKGFWNKGKKANDVRKDGNPSEDKLKKGFFKIYFSGMMNGEEAINLVCDAPMGDPGYYQTGRMAVEYAILLSKTYDDTTNPQRFGCLTPITAVDPSQLQKAMEKISIVYTFS